MKLAAEFDFDPTAQALQKSQLLLEYKEDHRNLIMKNLRATLNHFVKFRAPGQAEAFKRKDALIIGESHKFSISDIDKFEQEMPPSALIHFLNIQLKRKLLNKIVYKFPEVIFDKKEDEKEAKSASLFKLLWFAM